MRLVSTQQIQQAALKTESFDIFVGASGYEQRSVHCVRAISTADISHKVAFGFSDRITRQREDNDREFARYNMPVIASDGDAADELRKWIADALRDCNGDTIRVLIDYSSMTRTWYAGLIETVLTFDSAKRVECVLSYSVAEYSAPRYASANASVGPIPHFCSLGEPDKPTALVIGLGYEEERALGLWEYIDPGYTCAFYTDPALDHRFRDAVLENNHAFLSKLPKDRIYPYPVIDLQRTGDMLNSVCRALLEDYRVILAPLGMKPFSLLCLLLATKLSEADVWRVTAGTKTPPVDRKAAGPILALRAIFEPDETYLTQDTNAEGSKDIADASHGSAS